MLSYEGLGPLEVVAELWCLKCRWFSVSASMIGLTLEIHI